MYVTVLCHCYISAIRLGVHPAILDPIICSNVVHKVHVSRKSLVLLTWVNFNFKRIFYARDGTTLVMFYHLVKGAVMLVIIWHIVVGFTTTCVISAYHHKRCEFDSRSGEMYQIRHYVIKFVSDLRQVGCFLWVLRFPSPIKLTATI